MKISLITVCYNAANTIARCIESVIAQDHPDIEYIIIDGGSTDATISIINTYNKNIVYFISEPDKGIYDAMNKGIKVATGKVIGTLNADDTLASTDVLSSLAAAFEHQKTPIIYGNLNYIDLQGKISRKWVAGVYKEGAFNWGWMPPHPTFYCLKQLFEQYGYYDLQYGTAADHELMLRFMHRNKLGAYFLNKLLVNMKVGGVSNRSLKDRIKAWSNDYLAMRKNGVLFPRFAVVFKPLRKILQYI